MRRGLLLLVVGCTTPLAAQDTTVEALMRRAERLRAAAREAQAGARAAEGRNQPMDTIRIDPFTVLVPRGRAGTVVPGVEAAARKARSELGAAASLLRGRTIELAFGMGTTASGEATPVIGVADSASADAITEALVQWMGPVIGARAGALQTWATIPLRADREALIRAAYVDVATAVPGASARCLAGSLTDCALALGLQHPEDPATAFWDSAGRREIVQRGAPVHYTGITRRLITQCVAGFDDRSCVEALRRTVGSDPDRVRAMAPLGAPSRESLLAVALDHGGEDALRRLVADSTRGIAESIAAAAAAPLDTVLAAWHREVVAGRPGREVRAASHLLTVVWAVIFAGLALRGTRWRAG